MPIVGRWADVHRYRPSDNNVDVSHPDNFHTFLHPVNGLRIRGKIHDSYSRIMGNGHRLSNATNGRYSQQSQAGGRKE